jgi:hypothetical protein
MSRNTEATDDVKTWRGGPLNYKEGFFTQLQTDELAKGINEEVVGQFLHAAMSQIGCWRFASTRLRPGRQWKSLTG